MRLLKYHDSCVDRWDGPLDCQDSALRRPQLKPERIIRAAVGVTAVKHRCACNNRVIYLHQPPLTVLYQGIAVTDDLTERAS